MSPRRTAAAVLLAGALLLGASLAQRGVGGTPGGGYGGGYASGMMGGAGGPGAYGSGMHGYGAMGQGYGAAGIVSLDFDAARAMIRRGAQGATLDPRTNTVTYTGANIDLDVVAVQPDKPDTTFEIAGLVDPTVEIPRGATVTLRLVNMDYGADMPHGLVVTRTPPPYPAAIMPMLGSEMMRGGSVLALPPLPARSDRNLQNASYAAATLRFRATASGTYYYVCQVPGHAQHGMYGTLIVE